MEISLRSPIFPSGTRVHLPIAIKLQAYRIKWRRKQTIEMLNACPQFMSDHKCIKANQFQQ